MTEKDLLVTPILLIIIYVLAYIIRPYVTNKDTKRYFIIALTLKFVGAISLGLIYQFYYGSGDTFGFTTYGSHYIWEAFTESPSAAFKLIFYENEYMSDTFKYTSRMWYFNDTPSYFVVRVAGLIGILTFDTYSATAIFFALISFSGLWALFSILCKTYPNIHTQLAVAFFFVPSVLFWGSGVMKDTLALAALCWITYALIKIVYFKKSLLSSLILTVFGLYVIYIIKIYILLCYLPVVFVWLFLHYNKQIKSIALKAIVAPLLLAITVSAGYFGAVSITSQSQKYSLDKLLLTAEVTARDNSLWTVRDEGSGYDLGDYDFTYQGVARKFFPAIWTTLFRPYFWEINSIVMALSAFEGLLLLMLTIYILFKSGLKRIVSKLISEPMLVFFLVFTMTFAFAVGISSGNFGSLVRYKIPILPFFLTAIFVISNFSRQTSTKEV
ncbi:MAG: hypothetical protein AAFX87_14245 [Bacteroidota bacterium]